MPRSTKKRGRTAAPAATQTRAFDVELEEDEESDEQTTTATAATAAPDDPRKIPRAKRIPAEEFEAFLTNYPETDGTMFYLYRLEPKIDRTYTAGEAAETNIDKGKHQKFSLAWLRQTWGSGRYQVRFKDAGKQVCDSIIDINEYTEFPPILDVRELVDCDANRPLINNLIARGKAFRDGQGFLVPQDPNRKPLPGEPANNAEVVDRVLNFAEKMARGQQPGAGKIEEHAGLKAVDMMTQANAEMMKQFFAMVGAQGKGGTDGTLMTSLLTLLMNSQQQQQTLMLKVMETSLSQKGGGRGGLGSITDVLDLVDRLTANPLLGRLFSGGAAADVPWWQSLIEKVAPDLAGVLKTAIALRAQQQPATAPAAPAAIQARQSAAPAPAAPAAAPAAAPITPATTAGIPADQQNGIPATAEPAAAVEVLPPERTNATPSAAEIERAQVAQLGQQMFDQIERGQPGDRLADAIETFYGFTAYARIVAEGKEGILARLNSIPEFASTIAMMSDEVNQYLEEFIAYGQQKTTGAAA